MTSRLPNKICILDIETAETRFSQPETSKLAFVGLKVYTSHRGRYYAGKHRTYSPNQLAELETFLRNFPGLIIGHNVFQFDYRVLRPHISLKGIIEKTVDTLALLYDLNGCHLGGLALGDLSRINLGRSKSVDGPSISKLWNHGHQQLVIDYNENDCKLTMALWQHLIEHRAIQIDYRRALSRLSLSHQDLGKWLGRPSYLTFEKWEDQIRGGVSILPRRRSWYGMDWDVGPDFNIEYAWFYCGKCKVTFIFESRILLGNRDHKTASCPKCHRRFSDVQLESGSTLIGQRRGNWGQGLCAGDIPEPFRKQVLKHIESTRTEWMSPFAGRTIPGAKHCSICHRPMKETDGVCVNPVNEKPICQECATGARWQLSLK